MNRILLVIISVCFLISQSEFSYSQGLLNKLNKKIQEKVEEKVEKKVEAKVDEKIDEKIDQTLDGLLEGTEESAGEATSTEEKQNARMQKMMKGIGLSGEPVPISDAYSFDSKLQMHIESYDGKGKKESDGDFITYLSSNGKNFAYEFIGGDMKQQGKGTFIMDLGNKAMIILSEEGSERSGIVYGFDVEGLQGDLHDQEAYKDLKPEDVPTLAMNPHVSKTGRTKSIQGYRCDEYRYDDPEESTKASFWISNDVNWTTRDFMSTIFKSATYSRGMPFGFIMESESEDTKTGERTLMRVTDIDTKASKQFTMAGYQITNLGSMKMPAAQE